MLRVVPSQVVASIARVFPFTTAQSADHQSGKNVGIVTVGNNSMPQLRAVLALTDAVPDELLTMPPDLMQAFLVSKEGIRGRLLEWEAGAPAGNLGSLHELGNLNPVSWIRLALSVCPDQVPAAAVHALAFIADHDFRESLRIDIDTIGRALANQEWKPATVLAGSVIEALLLWRLEQDNITKPGRTAATATGLKLRHAKDPLTEWLLSELIAVAADHGHLAGDNLAAVKLAQNFRNLLHPGRAARLAEACNRGTAYSAVGAMERVITDLP